MINETQFNITGIISMILESLKKAIEKSGKTRYEIWKDTKVNQGVLSRIVKGGGCSVDAADKLAEYFGLELIAKKKTKAKKK